MIYFDNSATTQVLPEVLSTYNAVSEKIWVTHLHFMRWENKLLIC